MQKHYFELDKVDSITLTLERETTYRWYPEIPAKEKSFMGIKYGMTEVIPAGWSDYKDGWNPQPSNYFNRYEWYRVDEINKKIYHRAHVNIRLGYKEGFGCNFDSNEEAQRYVNELIATSDKKFTVITK